MISKLTVNQILLFLIVIFSISFFQLKYLNNGSFAYLQFAFLFLIEMISFPFLFRTEGPFALSVKLISTSILISIYLAFFSWGQGPMDSLKATVPYLLWLYFFYLMQSNLSSQTIERIIIFYGIIYILIYFFQFTHKSTPFFGNVEEFDNDRGITRIVIPGLGLFILSTFIAINKLTNEDSEKKYLWLTLAIGGIVITTMQVTRQIIAAVFFIYIFHFIIKSRNILIKIFSVLIIGGGLFLFTNTNNPIMKGLQKEQKKTASQGKDYGRILAANYFLTEFSPNTTSKILGNGVPYGDKSKYGKFYTKITMKKWFWLSDIGLIAVYILFGSIAVVGFVLIWIKSFTIPLPQEYFYLKYYLWFLLITCLTSDALFNQSFAITNVIVIYLYNKIALNEQTD